MRRSIGCFLLKQRGWLGRVMRGSLNVKKCYSYESFRQVSLVLDCYRFKYRYVVVRFLVHRRAFETRRRMDRKDWRIFDVFIVFRNWMSWLSVTKRIICLCVKKFSAKRQVFRLQSLKVAQVDGVSDVIT